MKYAYEIVTFLMWPFLIWLSYWLVVRVLRSGTKRNNPALYDAQGTDRENEW